MTRGMSSYHFQPIIEPSALSVSPWLIHGPGQRRTKCKISTFSFCLRFKISTGGRENADKINCGRVDFIILFNSLRQNPWSWFNSLRNSQVKIFSFCHFKIVKVDRSITGLDQGPWTVARVDAIFMPKINLEYGNRFSVIDWPDNMSDKMSDYLLIGIKR